MKNNLKLRLDSTYGHALLGIGLCVILLVGVALRIAYWIKFPTITTDGVGYCYNARSWIRSEPISSPFLQYISLYSFAIGIILKITGDVQFSARLVSFLCSVAVIPLTFFLGSRLFNQRTGLLAALFIALLERSAYYASRELTECMYMALYTIAIYIFLWAFHIGRWWQYALFGLVSGMAMMTRPEGLGLFPVALTAIVLFRKTNRMGRWKPILMDCGIVFATFWITCAPYISYLQSVTGTWQLTGKSATETIWTPQTRFSIEDFEMRNTINSLQNTSEVSIQYNIASIFKAYAHNLKAILYEELPQEFDALLLFLVPLGFVGYFSNSRSPKDVLVSMAFILPPFLAIPRFHFLGRYFVGYFPVLAIMASAGIGCLTEFLAGSLKQAEFPLFKRGKTKKVAQTCIFLFLTVGLTLSLLEPVYSQLIYQDGVDNIQQETMAAGRWIREELPSKSIIMSRKPETAFYAGTDFALLPWATAKELVAYGRKTGVNIVVLEKTLTEQKRPILMPLLTGQEEPPSGLRLIFREERFAVFKILPKEVDGVIGIPLESS